MKSSRISSMKSHTRAGRRSSLLVRKACFCLGLSECLTVRSVRFVRPLVACEPPFRCSSSFDWSANLPGERTHGTSSSWQSIPELLSDFTTLPTPSGCYLSPNCGP
uniref:(northern house mosquito) hypothetical protein n=1 Tax=Culex pipiens TaxID=7175 RepID=A0A8D8FK52_CULPI